ncbi:MAG: carotenoid 1,2-hydratase [Pseudomonadota bacterium]
MDNIKSARTKTLFPLAKAMDFTADVAPNGYVWWYVDALSDDGESGLTIIAFIGSVFSPYYASARRRGLADPENHVALNVALYGKGGKRWAMTERGRQALSRTHFSWKAGPSGISIDRDGLSIEIDEWTVPRPSRLRGHVRVTPLVQTQETFALDAAGRHVWSPLAPRCRVDVEMDAPSRRWQGEGYLDRNRGERPLEVDFSYWDWSCMSVGDHRAILYDVIRRDGSEQSLGLLVDQAGEVKQIDLPPRVTLAPNSWRVPRRTQSLDSAQILKTFEDTPFYSRSLIQTRILDESVSGMHESLSLDRFKSRVVQSMLPFRMPRRSW